MSCIRGYLEIPSLGLPYSCDFSASLLHTKHFFPASIYINFPNPCLICPLYLFSYYAFNTCTDMMRRLVKRCMYVCMIDEPGSTGSNARFMADSVSYMLEYMRSKKYAQPTTPLLAGYLF